MLKTVPPESSNMVVPLQTMTPVGPNTTLELSGIIADQRISLGLGTDWRNVPFYMQVRFDTKEIVFNNRDNGNWGTPMIANKPFNPCHKLEVTVNFTGPNYIVNTNIIGCDEKITFPNRTNCQKTSMIMVGGDLEITDSL